MGKTFNPVLIREREEGYSKAKSEERNNFEKMNSVSPRADK